MEKQIMAYVIYQLEGRLFNGGTWKYIGVTQNLKRRLGEHARDYRRDVKRFVDVSADVKTTILERKRSKPAAYTAESKRIYATSARARTTLMVNIQGVK